MPHQGKTGNVGGKDKSFAGTGIEGQKANGEASAKDKEEEAKTKAKAEVKAETKTGKEAEVKVKEATGSFDKAGANCIITHRDGPKRVWFRDGKEIGVEDAG